MFQNALVKNLLIHFFHEYLRSTYLAPGALDKAVNVTKEAPALTELTQMGTGNK